MAVWKRGIKEKYSAIFTPGYKIFKKKQTVEYHQKLIAS